MNKKKLRNKTRKLAKEMYQETLIHIDKAIECVECDDVSHTEWGLCYAVINAFLQTKQYPITRIGSNRLIRKIIKQVE